MDILSILATNVKYYRFVRGYSQERLAQECDLSPRTISDIENKRSNISIITLETLAYALDIDIMLLVLDQPHYKTPKKINMIH